MAKGPTWHVPKSKTPISDGDRDRDTYRDKHAKPPSSVPEFIEEEGTGRVEGPELQRVRANRKTPFRFQRLEEANDQHRKDIGEIKVSVAEIRGDVRAISKYVERQEEREAALFESETKVDTAVKIDAVEARKEKREAIMKVVLYIITGGLVGKILHTLGML